eukprot:5912066-Pyramimonas_sp.AAC.1
MDRPRRGPRRAARPAPPHRGEQRDPADADDHKQCLRDRVAGVEDGGLAAAQLHGREVQILER